MNPYDFVRTDWDIPPHREKPKLHHKFYKDTLSGKIECQLTAETLIFISMSDSEQNAKKYFSAHRNEFGSREEGAYFIPGSSLKGLFRNLVEVVGNGCYFKFDGNYEKKGGDYEVKYFHKLPSNFQKCNDIDSLCIGCRLFGCLIENIIEDKKEFKAYKGLVEFSDAEILSGESNGKFVISSLASPKPHHTSFYLDTNNNRISGRKFYFHSSNALSGSEDDFNPLLIYPIKSGAVFAFTVHFDNLTQSELNTLLYALALENNMRHKIGYAKPLGLGSTKIEITELVLISRHLRYANHPNSKMILQGNQLHSYLESNLKVFRENHSIAFQDLRRIWAWPPPAGVRYKYPSWEWFHEDGNSKLRINQIPHNNH